MILVTLLLFSGAPVIEAVPDVVSPGQAFSLSLVFPDDAEGIATLYIGDGRTEEINTAVGQVEVLVDAPAQPGKYVASVVFQQDGSQAEHSAAYTVQGEASQRSPLPAAILALVAAVWLRRR